MKISNRLFPYPVLSYDTSDYENDTFDISLDVDNELGNAVSLKADFSCSCQELVNLINSGGAEYAIHVECATTAFRKVYSTSAAFMDISILLSDVRDSIDVTGLIVLKRDISNLTMNAWAEDYRGAAFALRKGTILAYRNIGSCNISKNFEEFKDMTSIFSIVKSVSDSECPMKVSLDSDKINITLDKVSYEIYERASANQANLPLLNSLIILPALIYVVGQLQLEGNLEIYGSRMWFLSMDKYFKGNNASLEDVVLDDKSAIEIAQEIMELPICKALNGFKSIYQPRMAGESN